MRAALIVWTLNDAVPLAAQTAETPRATSPAPASGGLLGPSAQSGDDPRRQSPGIAIAVPPTLGPVQLPRGWTFRFDAPAVCTTCGDGLGPETVNANTPWRTSAGLNWQSDAGSLGFQVTGQRGARLPVYMAPSQIGPQMPAAAAEAILSDPRTYWQVTFSGERTLWRSRAGASLSLFGDLHLAVGTTGRAPRTEDVPTVSQTALLSGFRFGF